MAQIQEDFGALIRSEGAGRGQHENSTAEAKWTMQERDRSSALATVCAVAGCTGREGYLFSRLTVTF
jgi:hypothetical protein